MKRRRRSIVTSLLERQYRLPGHGLSRDEVREASVRGDLAALERRRAERGELTGEQDVRFGLELPGPALAGEVAALLREQGYAVEVERSDGAALLIARVTMPLDAVALQVHSERFCALADRYAGRYRGWALASARGEQAPPAGPPPR